MRKMLAYLLLALCISVGIPSFAAQAPSPLYTVQKGDTTWDLANLKLNDPFLWRRVVELNPFLQEPGRVFTAADGRTIVLIKPGEQLAGLEQVGLLPQQVPIESLGLPVPPTPEPVVVSEIPDWFWWLLALLALLLLLFLLWDRFNRDLNRDPVESGSPIIAGGVNDQTARERFEAVAANRRPGRRFTIVEQTSGRGWGVMNVLYADGKSAPRRLKGERVFKARVRYEGSAKEEELFMLQGCGNDLRYSGVSRYVPDSAFRFEADDIAPKVPPVTEVPAAPPSTEDAAPAKGGEVKFEYKPAEGETPVLVQLTGVEVKSLTFTSNKNGITLRYVPKG